jgi:methionine--tRNA ligase beta chain
MTCITFHEFERLTIRVVRVVAAVRIPSKSRILKLSVDIGQGEIRQMIAGGAEYYSPADFVNRKFIALVNLTPKRIAGLDSQGML